MAGKKVQLKQNGANIYPNTGIDCVYGSDNTPISDKIVLAESLSTYAGAAAPLDADTLEGNNLNQVINKTKPKLIWANPNPDAIFPSQSISFTETLNQDDLVLLVWSYAGGYSTQTQSIIIPVGNKHTAHWFERATIYQRDFEISTTGATVGVCYSAAYNANSWNTNNNFQIPVKIYKI